MRLLKKLAVVGAAGALGVLGAGVLGATVPAGAATAKMAQSNNWSGYNFPAAGSTLTPLTQVSATWEVPTASARTKNQDEYSAQWVGIGGGCAESSCTVTSNTLIQAGTESDVNADGTTTYDAWWETIPAPSVVAFTVKPGDMMSVAITQSAVPEVWNISIKDTTSGQSATAAVDPTPYPSDYLSAEYILETPVTASTSGAGLAVMPNLSTSFGNNVVNFDNATLNGATANLNNAVPMQLVDSNGTPVATPSTPDSNSDGFNVCVYASSCSPPAST